MTEVERRLIGLLQAQGKVRISAKRHIEIFRESSGLIEELILECVDVQLIVIE
jgi:hypothetical protein